MYAELIALVGLFVAVWTFYRFRIRCWGRGRFQAHAAVRAKFIPRAYCFVAMLTLYSIRFRVGFGLGL